MPLSSSEMEDELLALLTAIADQREAGASALDALSSLADEGHAPALLAAAHLACSVVDGRHLIEAARRYLAAEDREGLRRVFDVALRRGQVQVVAELRRTGRPELEPEDYPRWLERSGVPFFDLYRDREAGVSFLRAEDARLLREEAAACVEPPEALFDEALRQLDGSFPDERRALIAKLARREEPVVESPPSPRLDLDRRFRRACEERGVAILRTFQEPRLQTDPGGPGQPRGGVYLVRDTDGIAKVEKEVLSPDPRRAIDPRAEAELAERLEGLDFVPRLHGVEPVGAVWFRRMSLLFGQPLLDFVRDARHASETDARSIVGPLARALAALEARGVLYLDLRPQNVLVHPDGIGLLDVDSTRVLDEPGAWAPSHLYDARYAPPEVVLEQRVCAASSVFQLGVLFHQLLTGAHPFDRGADRLPDERDAETMLLRFALPSTVLRYRGGGLTQELATLLTSMLEPSPEARPSLAELADRLGPRSARVAHPRREPSKRPRSKNTVIFPARMGIPHRGHIDFCERVLEMGFHLHIALSRAFTITERDPYPKHLVMKMVARSLIDLGFGEDDFTISLTPFYATDAEVRMHFNMMPGREDLVAVASGSPDVAAVFSGLTHFEQRCVFGVEGERYVDRSWGATLRAAVREGDRARFDELAASGVTSILSFEALRERYAEQPVDFVRRVSFSVENGANEAITGRVRRYGTPAQSIVRELLGAGRRAEIIDLYAKDTLLELDGERVALVYLDTALDGDRATLRYRLERPG